ncbi:uncharacterized protein LOC128626779 [Artibeus jamaicensis]|uniref:uncharacterized protein LOC128626779 n=1 Tax=Artibeus jamaicensis TaxID=9417 RepID=UPI00235B1D1E|nr:uncharacterized protein LOC128626779 [Artibeus jamaicensis]
MVAISERAEFPGAGTDQGRLSAQHAQHQQAGLNRGPAAKVKPAPQEESSRRGGWPDAASGHRRHDLAGVCRRHDPDPEPLRVPGTASPRPRPVEHPGTHVTRTLYPRNRSQAARAHLRHRPRARHSRPAGFHFLGPGRTLLLSLPESGNPCGCDRNFPAWCQPPVTQPVRRLLPLRADAGSTQCSLSGLHLGLPSRPRTAEQIPEPLAAEVRGAHRSPNPVPRNLDGVHRLAAPPDSRGKQGSSKEV